MSLIGTFLPFCLNNNTYKYESHRGARVMTNKFESLLELLINEENEKAEALFHEIVVEKSRDIYEGLADGEVKAEAKEEDKKEETKETKDETKEDDKKEEVKETEKSDEKKDEKEETVDETKDDKEAEEKIKDEGVFTRQPAPTQAPIRKSDEESIEEIGGDATDELIKDISSDEEGDGDVAADELGQDMDADAENGENGEEGSVEDRVVDLEDALDELKAEFEAMLAAQNGEEEEPEEAVLAPKPIMAPQETQPDVSRFETKHKEDKKETVKEYKIQKSANNTDGSDKSAKSPVASGPKVKSAASPVKTGSGAEEKGRPAPTAKKIESGFENSPAKDKSTSYKKEVKADTKDGSDKSAKSPVASGK